MANDPGDGRTIRESRAPDATLLGGKYRLDRLLGRGGMGSVYEARHEVLGRRCAVKLLLPEIAHDPEAVQRFVREARAASAVGHPGIIDVYDVGTTSEGSPFLVMEFLEGESLAARLAREGRLPAERAAEVLVRTLDALGAAHDAGIIHRDLKPENLHLVPERGGMESIRILDFGISRMKDPARPEDHLTRTGTVMGTPYYMAPEQAVGSTDVDHRLDIYAAGVILFQCLTGTLPFEGSSYNQLIVRLATESFPLPRSVHPEVPAALEAVILRATRRDPADRFASAREMLGALLPFLSERVRTRLGFDEDPPGDAASVSRVSPAEAAPTVASPAADPVHAVPTDAPPPGSTPGPRAVAGASAVARASDRASAMPWAAAAAAVAVVAVLLVLRPWNRPEASVPPPVGPSVAAPDLEPGAGIDAVPVSPDEPEVGASVPREPGIGGVPPAPPPPPPPDAAPSVVTLRFIDVPSGASIWLDGAWVPDAELPMRRSDAAVQVEVRAPGFDSFRQWVVPDRDREVRAVLVPAAMSASAGLGESPAATESASGGGEKDERERFDPIVFRRGVASTRGELRECYAAGLARDARAAGEMVLLIEVREDGVVRAESALPVASLDETGVTACVVAALGRLRFERGAPWAGGTADDPVVFRARYPMKFEPEGE